MSERVQSSHQMDLKIAEIIGMLMGAMTAEGLHAILWHALLKHQATHCEYCDVRYHQR